jgi:hypothetical protein
MSPTVALAGSVAQKPHQAGHTWQFLQYLLGLRRLGWDVLFIDRLEADMCTDRNGRPCPVERSVNLRYLAGVMRHFGLEGAWTLLHDGQSFGIGRREVLARVRRSALLVNVMGFLDDDEILAAAPRRVFLDTDPGFGQMWHALGLADLFAGHDDHVTIAENIGRPDCRIPTCEIDWLTTKQPVLLDEWRPDGSPGDTFTSVGAWRGPYAPIAYEGTTYGLRVHEFRRFAALPSRADARFEVALDIDSAETHDLDLLRENGWSLVDPQTVAWSPEAYRGYVQRSLGEIMVAKGIYVQTRSGWFSERSECYLASGRPVLAQDTGLEGLVRTGEGLITYSTLEEAVTGAEEIAGDPQRHMRAAREIAEEFFDSDRVLSRLLCSLGVAA